MISVCVILCILLQPHLRFVCILYKTSSLTAVVILINVPALINYPHCFFDKMPIGTDRGWNEFILPFLPYAVLLFLAEMMFVNRHYIILQILSFQLFYLCIHEKFVTITTVCMNNLLISLQYWSLLTEGNWGINWRMKFSTIPWLLGYPTSFQMMARKRLM